MQKKGITKVISLMQIYGDGTLNDISCHKKGEYNRRCGKFVIYSKQTNPQPLTLYANSLRFHLIKPCRFPIKSMFTFNIRLANRIPPFSPKTTIVERQYLGLCELFFPPSIPTLFCLFLFSIFHTIEHETKTMPTHGNYVATIPQLSPLESGKAGTADSQILLP